MSRSSIFQSYLLLHWLRVRAISLVQISWSFLFLFPKQKIGKGKGKNQSLYYLYLEVVSIANSKSQCVPEDAQDTNNNVRALEHLDLYTFSPRDLEFIVKFSEEHGSDVFRQILQSICPSIYGHELVKGILKQLLLIFFMVIFKHVDKIPYDYLVVSSMNQYIPIDFRLEITIRLTQYSSWSH